MLRLQQEVSVETVLKFTLAWQKIQIRFGFYRWILRIRYLRQGVNGALMNCPEFRRRLKAPYTTQPSAHNQSLFFDPPPLRPRLYKAEERAGLVLRANGATRDSSQRGGGGAKRERSIL